MAREKTTFVCQSCGNQSAKWMGRCSDCGTWNSMVEEVVAKTKAARQARSGKGGPKPRKMSEVEIGKTPRVKIGISELDRILGGGLVRGAMILLGGEPGVGKSTLLLESVASLAKGGTRCLYVSGEESLEQIRMRADRLGLPSSDNLLLLAETRIDVVLEICKEDPPEVLIIDSIQTSVTEALTSAAGSVSQIREVASQLQTLAKGRGIAVFLVGHVTKEGSLAGPKVLEHIVDTVIYFEGEGRHPYRVIRAVKNRFGATHEVGLFEMKGAGLVPVSNPSALLLSERPEAAPGTVVVPILEGSRPLLVEIQALAGRSSGGIPRRTAIGLDQGRVSLLAAVLEKAGLPLYDRDLYVNVVGGIRITEPAADLGVILAIASSLKDIPIPRELLVVGEVGLTGEIRGVSQLPLRLQEGSRHGFSLALTPHYRDLGDVGLEATPVRSVAEALVAALS